MEDNAARKQGAGHGTDDPQVHTRRARGRPINRSAAEVDYRAPAKRALAQGVRGEDRGAHAAPHPAQARRLTRSVLMNRSRSHKYG